MQYNTRGQFMICYDTMVGIIASIYTCAMLHRCSPFARLAMSRSMFVEIPVRKFAAIWPFP